jgi:hypothetical protein
LSLWKYSTVFMLFPSLFLQGPCRSWISMNAYQVSAVHMSNQHIYISIKIDWYGPKSHKPKGLLKHQAVSSNPKATQPQTKTNQTKQKPATQLLHVAFLTKAGRLPKGPWVPAPQISKQTRKGWGRIPLDPDSLPFQNIFGPGEGSETSGMAPKKAQMASCCQTTVKTPSLSQDSHCT